MGSMRKTNDCQKTTGIAVHSQEKNVMSLGDVTALLRSPALTFLTVGGAIHRDAWMDKYGFRYRR